MPRVRFQPLRINKRRWRSSWFSGAPGNDSSSLEKDAESHFLDDPDDDYETESFSSNASSRDSSGSWDSEHAMLPQKKPSTPATSSAYSNRIKARRKCNRYFTIILGSTLLLMVLALAYLHFHSARDIELRTHRVPSKPALYEGFPRLKRYFGGLRSIVSSNDNVPEYPRSGAESAEDILSRFQNTSETTRRQGRLLETITIDTTVNRPCSRDTDEGISILGISGRPSGFPEPVSGINLASDITHCLERFGRLGPYGLGYSRRNGGTGGGQEGDRTYVEDVWANQTQIDFRSIDWAQAKTNCTEAPGPQQKSAILYRTQADHRFDPEEILALRALIAETAVAFPGTFTVYILVELPENSAGVWSDERIYTAFLEKTLPTEFHKIGKLWSIDQMRSIYGDLAQAYHGDGIDDLFVVQHFARENPEIDFFWNWDPRIRSVGHIGQTLQHMSDWANDQPMKELWNRNDRFYLSIQHGNWEDFRQMVRVQSEHGSSQSASIWSKAALRPGDEDSAKMASMSKPVWGPVGPLEDVEASVGHNPPMPQEKDRYEWGIGHDADLITLSPIFDPDGTLYGPSEAISGYNLTLGYPPRRASVSGLMRFSKQLLESMHRQSLQGRGMHSTMWPASIALHLGFKAVYVPQSVYVDREWPTDYLAATLNSGLNGAVGGARTSVFDDGRVHNLQGLSWATRSSFASKLWKRWLGYRVDGEGGEEWELRAGSEGRMCLPPMMLWPVEGIELIIQ